MSHELLRIAAELEAQNFPEGAARVGALVDSFAKEPGLVPDTLGLTILKPESEVFLGIWHHEHFDYNFDRKFIVIDGEEIHITPTEATILELHIKQPNIIIPRRDINRIIWGYPNFDSSELLKAHYSHLNRKLGNERDIDNVFTATNGVGYRLIDKMRLVDKGERNQLDIHIPEDAPKLEKYSNPFFDFYPEIYVIVVEGKEIPLTKIECDILRKLSKRPGLLVKTRDLKELLLDGFDAPNGYVKTHISHIRTKIVGGREIAGDKIIRPVVGFGYKLVEDSYLSIKED